MTLRRPVDMRIPLVLSKVFLNADDGQTFDRSGHLIGGGPIHVV